jgi:hypothetical protein
MAMELEGIVNTVNNWKDPEMYFTKILPPDLITVLRHMFVVSFSFRCCVFWKHLFRSRDTNT